ncbi:MAG: DUF885 family protein, partial [Candidatus Sulfotelmatobacter sp.]
MRPIPLLAVILFAVTIVLRAHSQNSSASSSSSNIENHQRLLKMFDEEWQYELRTAPEFATSLGDKRYNDRFSDQSPRAIEADLAQNRAFLARFEAFNASGLSAQDALSLSLMVRKLRQEIEGAQFKPWE